MDDQKADEIALLWQAIRDLQTATPGDRATVARGQSRFEGIEAFILSGTGIVNFASTLLVIGEAKFQGATTIQNTLDVTAETRMRGATTIENTLDVAAKTTLRGETELQADLNVKNGGKVTLLGAMTVIFGQVGAYIGLFFGNGARLIGWAGGVALQAPNGTSGMVVTNASVKIASTGTNGLELNATGTVVNGPVFLMDLPVIENVSANVTVDPTSGQLGTA
jgi:hypothetical protein